MCKMRGPKNHFTLSSVVLLTLIDNIAGSRIWGFLGKRTLSPDNTCGNTGAGNKNGYVCNPALPQGGRCCSANGYCGNSTNYCGPGCQSAFGVCITGTAKTDMYVCGASNGGASCAENQCCSPNGYCGNTTAYCGTGCQGAYGRCSSAANNAGSSSITSSTSMTLSEGTLASSNSKTQATSTPGGGCGPQNGGLFCPSGQCCSPEGWCGTTQDYCADPDCQYAYGLCDSYQTPAGPSTANDPRPFLGSVSYNEDIIDCTKQNVVALTFDDGPYLYTNALLDILQQFNFTATFFITGNNLGKGPIDTTPPYPSIIKRMIADGHQVASHTWSHYSLSNISSSMRIQQMTKNERAIANIIGKYPTYMRPPFSQCSKASGCWADMQKLGYHRTYFDLDTQDYLNPLPSQIQNSKDIVKNFITGPGSIGSPDWLSIQHDIVQESVTNLSAYYYGLIKSKGWKGVTVGECLNDSPKNWYRTPGATTSTISQTSSLLHSSSTSQHSASTSRPTNSTTEILTSMTSHGSTSSLNNTTSNAKSSFLLSSTSQRSSHATSSNSTLSTSGPSSTIMFSTFVSSNTASSLFTLPFLSRTNSPSTAPLTSSQAADSSPQITMSPLTYNFSSPLLPGASSSSPSSSLPLIINHSTSGLTFGSSAATLGASLTLNSSNFPGSSTSCSLTTGLSTGGETAQMTIYHGSSFLLNTTQTMTGLLAGSSTSQTSLENVESSSTAPSSTSSSDTGATSTSSTSGPTIPTHAGAGYAYVGCFVDDQVYRVASGSGYRYGVTVSGCADYCYNQQAPVFAIEYYAECFCGQSMNSTLGRSQGCNYVCTYNSSETCGGFYAAQVYSQNIFVAQNASVTDNMNVSKDSAQSIAAMTTGVGFSASSKIIDASDVTQNTSTNPSMSTANPSVTLGVSSRSKLTPASPIPSAIVRSTDSISSAINATAASTANRSNTSVSQADQQSSPTSSATNATGSNDTTIASLHSSAAKFTTWTSLSNSSATAAPNGTASGTYTNTTSAANTTATSSPSSLCVVQAGSFCGSIAAFASVDGCWDAVTNCTEQNAACYGTIGGDASTSRCAGYTQECVALFWYCMGCGAACSSQSFLISLSQALTGTRPTQ